VQVYFEENRQERNQDDAAAEAGERPKKARGERASPDKERKFGNVHPSVCHSSAEKE
jgi:hypothetical protein